MCLCIHSAVTKELLDKAKKEETNEKWIVNK